MNWFICSKVFIGGCYCCWHSYCYIFMAVCGGVSVFMLQIFINPIQHQHWEPQPQSAGLFITKWYFVWKVKSKACFWFDFSPLCIFIGPRCPWSDLWVLVSQTEPPCVDLTDATLADEDTKSILTENANRAIQGNLAMQVASSGGKICN